MTGTRPFFFKRWMLSLGDTYDQWLFGFTSRNGETIGSTHWRSVFWGIVAGVVGAIKSMVSGFVSLESFSAGVACMITFIVAIVYAIKNVRLFLGIKKLTRLVYIISVCVIGLTFGYFIGMMIGMVIVSVILLLFFFKLMFSMICNIGGTTKSNTQYKKRYYLDDGSEVEEIGNNVYEDVAGYTRYRKKTFSDEFEKIDW